MTFLGTPLSPAKASVPYLLAISAGVLSSTLGASVLVAWYTHNASLIQVSTAFVPMQFNTALGFLLSGLGLLGVSTGHRAAGMVCGIFVLFAGLLTLAEYLFGIDPGIDQLLMQHYVTVLTSSPGRMAPETAVCFSLTGTALIVLGTRANIWKPAMLAGVLGSLSAGLGFVVLTAYAIGLKTSFGGGESTRMAVHAAGGFMLLGMGIVSLVWQRDVSSHSHLPGWFPAPVGIGVATIAISLWRSFAAQHAQIVSKYGISEDLSFINDLFLTVGIVLAITLALGVYLAQAARKQAREVKATNRRLTAAIGEREWAEKEWGKLAQAVEQSPESIVITNLAAEIEYVNAAFTRLSGYSREEVLGKNPRILQSGKTPRETHAAMWKALRQNQSWTGEFCNKSKDGREYVEFVTIAPIHQADGAVSHYLAIKQDITAKKQLAEELDRHRHHLTELVEQRTAQLAEAQLKAEAANQAKSTFLANMSHEIRTPMNAIVGLTHLLQQADPTPEQAQWLDRINASTRHLLSIINDILDLAKIEAGKLSLEQCDFHLEAIFDHAQSLFGEQVRSKGLSFKVDLAEVPRWLKGDPTRLRQALFNYVGNAIKFTEQGTIFLRARKLQECGNEILLRFEVQDTGIGIEPGKLPRLFKAFEQADASITRNYGGTGLGLAITRNLAQMMGGEAGADSKPGRGSTFWFTALLGRGQGIQTAAAASAMADSGKALRPQFGGARILLAEDNAINREVALALLGALDLTVETAENGREAVDKVRANAYDLVLMDVQMPEMDGLDAARVIRAMDGRAGLPILAMTGAVFEEDRRACLQAGMNDFITKPIDMRAMFATLAKWLPQQASADMQGR